MSGTAGRSDVPPHVSPGRAFLLGLRVMPTTPGAVLFATALGFGALARDLGFTGAQAGFLSVAMYALPAQVILVDTLARGGGVAAAAFAVTLSAVRLLPMTVAIVPLLRGSRGHPLLTVIAVHFVAVTAWIEGNRRLPDVPIPLRLHYFVGIGVGMAFATFCGTMVGYVAATSLPRLASAALLMMTPAYFALSLFQSAKERADGIAIALGLALGPLFYLVAPGFDLMLTGLVGGTVAYLAGRRVS